jgi:hypothetical protein
MSQPNGPGPSPATCASCGAPDDGEFVVCRFCKNAVSAEAQRTAIPCPNPQCKMLCRWGKQKCASCQSWIIVSCVFCGSLSPHNCSNCLRCNEAFAGAPQRKAAMQQQQAHQQNMQAVGTWGHVAAAFAGAAVGSAVSHGVSHHYYHHDSCNSCSSPVSSNDYDVSNVIDDVGDIGGGSWDE